VSAEGIRNAAWLGRVQPHRARAVAAELRNAITPASLALSSLCLDDEDSADIRASIDHILAIADALQPKGIAVEYPCEDNSGGHDL